MSRYHPKKTPASDALTDLIRSVLRLSAHAGRVGSDLTKDLGLTNARWQLLGELAAAPDPLTVSGHARRMGLSRQAVQRLADEMAADELVRFDDNPADRRARVVVPTDHGRAVYRAALEREWPFTNTVADGFDPDALRAAVALVEAVTEKVADYA